MSNRNRSLTRTARLAAVLSAAALSAAAVEGGRASAQEAGTLAPAASAVAAAPAYKPVPALRLENAPAFDVAQRVARASGATILVTGNLTAAPVKLSTIGGSVEVVLPQIAAVLPKGTVIRAVFVPAPEGYQPPTGDSVAAYLNATAALQTPPRSGSAPAASAALNAEAPAFAPGMWEVLGRRLPTDRAVAATAGLGLRPVYLIALPTAKADPVALASQLQTEGLRLLASMTPEQKQATFDQQMNALLNMPPADRRAMLGQMMSQGATMMKSMMALTPDQRNALMSDFRAAAQDAGLPVGPPPGAGAPSGGAPGTGR